MGQSSVVYPHSLTEEAVTCHTRAIYFLLYCFWFLSETPLYCYFCHTHKKMDQAIKCPCPKTVQSVVKAAEHPEISECFLTSERPWRCGIIGKPQVTLSKHIHVLCTLWLILVFESSVYLCYSFFVEIHWLQLVRSGIKCWIRKPNKPHLPSVVIVSPLWDTPKVSSYENYEVDVRQNIFCVQLDKNDMDQTNICNKSEFGSHFGPNCPSITQYYFISFSCWLYCTFMSIWLIYVQVIKLFSLGDCNSYIALSFTSICFVEYILCDRI